MKISYDWLKWYVQGIPEADALADIFMRHLCEVEGVEKLANGDTVYDLNILPNRAHDLLSHHGVARELCGQLGLAFNDPTPKYAIPEAEPTKLSVRIETPAARRYSARIVRGITVGPSPEWVVKHLESIGQKAINNIVDATNIVMFDCGQPCHAFDLATLAGEQIVVRAAADGEEFQTVGGDKIVAKLKATDTVITDGEKTLAIAGVKGGADSGISATTTDILLEVANFDPVAVRKTARRLGLLSDSAKRFENDLSPEHAGFAMRELSGLMLELFPGATFEEVVDVYPVPQEKRTLSFLMDQVNGLLGAEIPANEAEDILKRYGYEYEYTREGDALTLTVPPLRLDLSGPHDMAEEIGRIRGYDTVVPALPKLDFVPKENETREHIRAARAKLLSDGYSETMTYAFCKKGAVEVARGAKGKEFLRTNLADGLRAAYDMNRLNAPLLGADEARLFEIGTVFPEAGREEIHIAYADKKGVVESTLEEFARDLDISVAADETPASGKRFVPWSPYPFISRDLAVWVPAGTEASELVALCRARGTELLAREPRIFDRFEKDGRISLAARLVFQSPDRTLTDEEVSVIMESISQAVREKGWEIR